MNPNSGVMTKEKIIEADEVRLKPKWKQDIDDEADFQKHERIQEKRIDLAQDSDHFESALTLDGYQPGDESENENMHKQKVRPSFNAAMKKEQNEPDNADIDNCSNVD
ncbi:MAG: hypothetical protein ACE5DO_10895 [Desulfobacterales bacterium]